MNASTEYLAIQHIPSGKFLPDPQAKQPFTHVEPVAPWIHPPRLFTKNRSAEMALTWYLKGRVNTVYDQETGEDLGTEISPVPTRKREEYHVVPVELRWKTTQTASPTNQAALAANKRA